MTTYFRKKRTIGIVINARIVKSNLTDDYLIAIPMQLFVVSLALSP